MLGGRSDGHPRGVRVLDEDPVQLRTVVFATIDAQRQMFPQLVELADLDRRPQRTGFQVELKSLVAIVGVGLEIADDEQVNDR